MDRLLRWLFEHSPITKAHDAGYRSGYEAALKHIQDAKVVWEEGSPGWIDKPATIALWKKTHISRWSQLANLKDYTSRERKSLQTVPHNIKEHEAYLDVFPDLED